ncbi:hypothetical protein AALO_G00173980 [Alosa alosa]|uniref:Ig-like domain-containing protein n=1 Tax=Alosa alosa TaxID=278164 RepID=A0AAV6G728_9TELE|nr:hypothetical protein AALO_G00173980 [Alosa alosa]
MSSVNLICNFQGNVTLIEWTKGGKALCPSNRITFQRDNRILKISPVERTDTGEYTCRLSNPVSVMATNYNLIVRYGPLNVTVRGTGEINAPDNTTFSCSADSQPPANFSWTFNGKGTGVTGPVFNIVKSKAGDSGNYTCIASNDMTGDKVPVTRTLIVNYGPVNVTVRGTGEINAPDNTTFSCSADSQPPANFSWTFNDKGTGVTGPVFNIVNSNAEKSGNYTCIASNDITGDKVPFTRTLTVNYGPLNVTVRGTGEINAPDNTTFTCSADSQPPANFSWTFNDKGTGVTGPVFNIVKSKVGDSGNYTCIASNDITGSKVSITQTLIVNGSSFIRGGIRPAVMLWMSMIICLIF